MRIEEVAVAGPRMAPGRGARPTLQHELAAHELAIIFADRAFYRSEAGIGQIGGAGPFPDIAENVAQAVSRAGRAPPDRAGVIEKMPRDRRQAGETGRAADSTPVTTPQ